MAHRDLARRVSLPLVVGVCLVFLALDTAPQIGGGPSAFCHETDGAFTICPDSNEEWSDVTPQFFLESESYLYADQADLDPDLASPGSSVDTFMLLYDECRRTTPLGPNEYFRVSFTTVEEEDSGEKLEHYVVHIFSDGTIIFFEDGELQANAQGQFRVTEIEGQRGSVGFGPSPNCPEDHVVAEFEIKLSAAVIELDGAYSPDPQFWSSGSTDGCTDGPVAPEIVSITPSPSVAELRERYTVNVAVRLRESCDDADNFPRTITVSADETEAERITLGPPPGRGDALLSPPAQTRVINPGELISFFFEYRHEWDWSGFGSVSCFSATLGGVLGTVGVGALSGVFETVADGLGGALGGTANVTQVLEILEAIAQIIPENRYRVTVVLTEGSTTLQTRESTELERARVIVPTGKFFAFGTYFLSVVLAGYETGLGIVALGGVVTAPGSVPLFIAEALTMIVGCVSYNQAVDPDPNFDEVATPQPIELPTLDALPPSVGKDFARAIADSLVNQSVVMISLSRYEGAKEADSVDGMMLQLEAAHERHAAYLQNLADLTLLTEDFIAELEAVGVVFEDTDIEQARNELSESGLPEVERAILTELGIETEDIDTLELAVPELVGIVTTNWQQALRTYVLEVGAAADQVQEYLDQKLAAIANGGFETCTLDGWDVASGSVASAISSLGPDGAFTPILPAEGQCMAFLSTAGTAPTPPGTTGSVISQTFVIPSDASTLGLCYQYVSNDSQGFENFLLVELETTLGTFTLGSADNAAGSPAGGFVPPPPPSISDGVTLTPASAPVFLSGVNILGSALFVIPFSLMTDRVCATFDIPKEIGGTVATLRFIAGDVLDTAFASAVVIDVVGFDGILPLLGDTDGDGVLDELDNCPGIGNPDQEDSELNGTGDACQTSDLQNSTAAFLQAVSDGTTTVEPTPLPLAEEPPLSEKLVRIVDFRVTEGLTDSGGELTENLVASLVEVGLVLTEEADELIDEVIDLICRDFPCGRKANKVLVCHVPRRNPGNAHTICIRSKAVLAHLENHGGDFCGPCVDLISQD